MKFDKPTKSQRYARELPKTLFAKACPEISLELNCAPIILKAEVHHELPWAILGRMRRTACIMHSKPCSEIAGDADVALVLDCETLEKVDVFH